MKFLKILGGLIFFIILTTLGLSFLLRDYQKVTRSISINKPAGFIYDRINKLEDFNRFAIWSQQDSAASVKFSGRDGTVGASTHWVGHPMISGEGTITITELVPSKRVAHRIDFIKPKKGKADSVIDLLQTADTVTNVTWNFHVATPRPWNIFNLFYDLGKERGAEFEEALNLLKVMIEKD